MKIICDPGRHAICFGFDQATHALEGPEIQIDGETIGLFVDSEVNPRRLKGILFYRHRFYLPFGFVNSFAVSDLFIGVSRTSDLMSCSLKMFPDNQFEEWQVYRGVRVLIQPAAKTGKDRPTLLGFQVDTRIWEIESKCSEGEIYISTDSLKTN